MGNVHVCIDTSPKFLHRTLAILSAMVTIPIIAFHCEFVFVHVLCAFKCTCVLITMCLCVSIHNYLHSFPALYLGLRPHQVTLVT